jgi:hypothetical protein
LDVYEANGRGGVAVVVHEAADEAERLAGEEMGREMETVEG